MKTRTKIYLGLALFGMLPLLAANSAAASATADATYDLGKVIVSRQEVQGVEANETIRTVTAAQIRERNAQTLDEALSLLPGISVRTGGDGTPRIDIRGFRTRNVLLLLNGTPFNPASDGQFDPAMISVENIAEIKVITGGGSELYGPGGNGGVINIITKKGKTGLHGSAGGEIADGNARLANGSVSGGSDRVDYFVSASTYKRDDFPLSDDFSATKYEDGGGRENSDLRRNNVFANVGYSPSERTFLGMTFSYLGGDRGMPPVVNYSKNDPFASGLKYERLDDSKNYSVQLAGSHDLEGPSHLKGWVFFNQLDQLDNRYDDDTYSSQLLKGSSRTDSTTRISGANLQYGYDLPANSTATLGLMVENDDWDADGFQQVQQKGAATASREQFDESHRFQVYSTLLQYDAAPTKKFGMDLGLGYHWQNREDDTESAYSYVVGAHYDLTAQTRLKVSHARKIRFPTLADLYDPNGGNAALKAETTRHYEAGIEQSLPAKTTLSLTGFYIDVNDFIEKNAVGVKENFEHYTFTGFETTLENRTIDNLLLRVSYSYMDSEDRSSGSQKDELQYRPRDKFTLEANYRLPWGMSIYGSLLYVANQYFYDKTVTLQQRLPDYTLVDLKVSQPLLARKLDLYVGANNLFDENYEQSYGLPQAGRTVYGGLDYRF